MFNVGSLSKGVAALTVLRLVREGKIDLNRNVNEQLISWKLPENEFTKQGTVTPLLLMNHSGGVMFSPPYSYLPENLPTLLQLLNGESPAQSRPVVVDRVPGTEYMYSNAGYSILQQLTIDVEKKPYPEITREKIFRPLGMDNSSFEQPLPADLLKNACAGHSADGKTLAVKRYVYPIMAAGGLWTTTSDYARYVTELQKTYQGRSDKIISRELAGQMLTSHVSEQYGLGVFIRDYNGEKNYFGHLGDNRGFFAGFIAHLTDGYGAVVFTNAQNGAELIREIFNGIAAVYGWKGYLPEEYKIVALADTAMDRYTGRYLMGSDDYFEIKKVDNHLYLNRFDNARLYHVGDGKFVTKFRKGYLQFVTAADRNSSSAVYHFSDELGRFLNEPVTCSRMDPDDKVPLELLNEGKIAQAMDRYRTIKQSNPADVYLSENRFNNLGYQYLAQQKYEQALAIFKLNVEFYPESANCYDSLAEAYMNNGDTELAILNYRKSLELNPDNQNAVRMLKKLDTDN
jgi:CubicO group peptidase (beta-lactamase class C family)